MIDASSKIVITGSDGQLGLSFRKVAPKNSPILYLSKEDLDITDTQAIASFFEKYQPQFLINTAAYTQVDAAENHSQEAFLINRDAVKILTENCLRYNCKLIHFSTDYVFDGKKTSPYKESDTALPTTVYGKSKRAGEEAIIESGLTNYLIIRTSWLYSEYGNNFYKTMLRLAKDREEVRIVNDQRGCPTYAPDLAAAVLRILPQFQTKHSGVYHYCLRGETTWYEFASAIFQENHFNINTIPITTKEYPTPAARPAYSVLNTQKIVRTFGLDIPSWRDRLNLDYIEF